MDPVGTMAGPVAADIACQAAVGGYHASSIRVPYEDYSTGASSVVVRVLEITQDPPAMLLRGELRISWLASVCFAAAHF
jgi:hypothetical protein